MKKTVEKTSLMDTAVQVEKMIVELDEINARTSEVLEKINKLIGYKEE